LLRAAGTDRERFYRETLLPYKLEGYIAYNERRTAWTDLCTLGATLKAVVHPAGSGALTIEEIEADRAERKAAE
jgi:hypothetical protein